MMMTSLLYISGVENNTCEKIGIQMKYFNISAKKINGLSSVNAHEYL